MRFHNQNPIISRRGALSHKETLFQPTAPYTHPERSGLGQWVGPYKSPSPYYTPLPYSYSPIGLGGTDGFFEDLSVKFKAMSTTSKILLAGGLIIGSIFIYKHFKK